MEVFEGLLRIAQLALYWRVVLCLLLSSSLAFFAVQVFPWFTGLQGVVLAATGFLPGAYWEASSSSTGSPNRTEPTSAVVAAGLAVVLGATWGAASSQTPHSFIAGALMLALSLWGWSRYASTHLGLGPARKRMCMLVATFGYLIAAALARNAL